MEEGRKEREDIKKQLEGMSSFKHQVQQKSKPCGRCGGAAHISESRVTEESTKSQWPAFKAKCRKCNQRGHFARVCKSKKDEKGDKEEANALEAEFLFALRNDSLVVIANDEDMGLYKLKEKHLLNMVSSTRKDHRRFLKHMIFDKKVGKYVTKQTTKAKILDMDIIMDVKNYELVSPSV